jgi:hypothetical protein
VSAQDTPPCACTESEEWTKPHWGGYGEEEEELGEDQETYYEENGMHRTSTYIQPYYQPVYYTQVLLCTS